MELYSVVVCLFAAASFVGSLDNGVCERFAIGPVVCKPPWCRVVTAKYTTPPRTTKSFIVKGCCENYERVRLDPLECRPTCYPACENSVCIEPNLCRCNDGFVVSNYAPNICLPSCSKGCTNGECIAPDVCRCYPGTIKINETFCAPECKDGTTPDCYHIETKLGEFPSNKENMIFLPNGTKALTMRSNCENFVQINEMTNRSHVIFECSNLVKADSCYSFCHLASGDSPNQGVPVSRKYNVTSSTNIHFRFAYPNKAYSTAVCELCFCSDFMDLNRDRSEIRLCPCAEFSEQRKEYSMSHIFGIIGTLVILSMTTFIACRIVLKRKNFRNSSDVVHTNEVAM